MKQFILDTGPDQNGQVRLDGDSYRYLVRVRRLAPGEYFPALLPGGAEASVRVLSVDSRVLVGEIIQDDVGEHRRGEHRRGGARAHPLPPIMLLQALPKGDKMDLIVRQAAEGALDEIVPFISEFSVARVRGDGGQRLARWQRIIREARQQSGSAVATQVRGTESMDGIFAYWEQVQARWPDALGLLLHHQPLANGSLHRYLGKSRQDSGPGAVAMAIGPEGGFSPAEAQRFLAAGFMPFTIGDTVLRVETAALYAQAAVRVLLAERDSWETR